LPPSVANELRHQRPVPAKKYECVTLLFSGIVGFSQYCAKNSDSKGAMKIVKLLNSIYTTFDVLTDPKKNPNVYKVFKIKNIYIFIFLTQKFPNKSIFLRLRQLEINIWQSLVFLSLVNVTHDVLRVWHST
jgi:hypothetical protein